MFDAALKTEIHVKPLKSNREVVPEAPKWCSVSFIHAGLVFLFD